MNIKRMTMTILLALLMAGACFSQTVETPKYFHLDFVVKELEGGKVTNSRAYGMTIATVGATTNSSIRTGNRVPVSSGGGGQWQYIDVGTNIDCRSAKEVPSGLALNVTADISGAATEQGAANPVIRQTKWGSDVVVALRKATVIFASDDPSSKRQMQLELTAAPIQ